LSDKDPSESGDTGVWERREFFFPAPVSPLFIEPNTFEGQFKGPNCALRLLDMGIAIGSAVKTASLFNVDNRIIQRIGVVAREMGLIDADFVMGIPLSATGKNIYFDRS